MVRLPRRPLTQSNSTTTQSSSTQHRPEINTSSSFRTRTSVVDFTMGYQPPRHSAQVVANAEQVPEHDIWKPKDVVE